MDAIQEANARFRTMRAEGPTVPAVISGDAFDLTRVFTKEDLTVAQTQQVIMTVDKLGKHTHEAPLVEQQARLQIHDLTKRAHFTAWGFAAHDLPIPGASKSSDLKRELRTNARLKHARKELIEIVRLRFLLERIEEEKKMQAQMRKLRDKARAEAEEEKNLRAQFEEEERAEADRRFEAWKKVRAG